MRFSTSLAGFFLVMGAALAQTPDVPLDIKGGNAVIVKIDKIIVVKTDRLVVQTFPFTVNAPSAIQGFFFWTYPPSVVALDKGAALEIASAPKGDLTISVKMITADWDKKQFVTKFGSLTFSVGDVGPPIPPDPKPDPPSPSPFPVGGMRVLVVYETADLAKIPRSQAEIFTSTEIRQYLDAKCVKGPDGKTAEYRFFDKDVDLKNEAAVWQTVWKKPRPNLPWLYVGDGTKGYDGPLPDSIMKTMELLRKIGG